MGSREAHVGWGICIGVHPRRHVNERTEKKMRPCSDSADDCTDHTPALHGSKANKNIKIRVVRVY